MERKDNSGQTADRVILGCRVVTIAGALAGVYGIIEGIRYQNTPDYQNYQSFSTHVSDFESQLVGERVLARTPNGLYIETRIPSDPRVAEWGRLKNELDVIDEQRRATLKESLEDGLKSKAAVWGTIFALFGLSAEFLRRTSRLYY